MKKNIILLSLITSIFLLSGCTVESNIIIKNDGSVFQDGTVVVNKKIDKKNQNEVKNKIISEYKRLDKNLNVSFKNNITVSVNNEKNSLKEFFDNSNINLLYDDYEIVENNETLIFYTVGYPIYYDLLYMQEDTKLEYYKELVDKIIINIQFENKVISSNADIIDEDKNIYTWVLDKSNLDKTIKFSCDKKKIVKNIKIKKEAKKSAGKLFLDDKKFIIIFFLVILISGFVTYYKRGGSF